MVGVLRRMNKLKSIYGIKHGPGAAVLPLDVARIHMEFAMKMNDGHMGPRKFWRENLPRLKYWNPSVPMIVNRTEDQTSPATMTVYFYQNRDGTSTPNSTTPTSSTQGRAKAPPPSENERVLTIDMKHQHSDDILATFMQKTGAVPVVPTTQDESEMRELDSLKQRGTIDRARVLNDLTAARREARMLAQAQSQVVAMKAT